MKIIICEKFYATGLLAYRKFRSKSNTKPKEQYNKKILNSHNSNNFELFEKFF